MKIFLELSYRRDSGVYTLIYLEKTYRFKIYLCTGTDNLDDEIKKYLEKSNEYTTVLIPISMINSRYQIIQGLILESIYGDKLKIKNPAIRIALLTTGYTQIKEYVGKAYIEYNSSGKKYYLILIGKFPEQFKAYNCRQVSLEELPDDLYIPAKNLRDIYPKLK